MTRRSRNTLLLLMVSCSFAFLALVVLYHAKTEQYAVDEARKQALNALLVHRAIHAYVSRVQRPEIYRLQEQRTLTPDYFSPKLMSFTYIARTVKDLLNDERVSNGLPEIYFKLATDNPRNPINKADPLESELLGRMNRGELTRFEEVVELGGQPHLYLAIPIARSDAGCQRCHGEPAAAPVSLLELYGESAGFFEKADEIRALISIRVPLAGTLSEAHRTMQVLAASTLLLLTGIYGLVYFFVRRLDDQQQQLMRANDELARVSVTDVLTDTLNRRGMSDRIDQEIARAVRLTYPLAVLMLDLDHFKRVNDRFGHASGDRLLREFARRVAHELRSSDLFARWGGEEFLILTPGQGTADAGRLAERLRAMVEATALLEEAPVTVSIGVTALAPGECATTLIARADEALYAAKEAGRNRVVIASPPQQ